LPVLRPDIDQIAAQEAALGGQSGVAVESVKLQRVTGGLTTTTRTDPLSAGRERGTPREL
jgi:hypothetical protein